MDTDIRRASAHLNEREENRPELCIAYVFPFCGGKVASARFTSEIDFCCFAVLARIFHSARKVA
jgi:hypothetical protein